MVLWSGVFSFADACPRKPLNTASCFRRDTTASISTLSTQIHLKSGKVRGVRSKPMRDRDLAWKRPYLDFFRIVISVDDDVRMVTICRMIGVVFLALCSGVVCSGDPRLGPKIRRLRCVPASREIHPSATVPIGRRTVGAEVWCRAPVMWRSASCLTPCAERCAVDMLRRCVETLSIWRRISIQWTWVRASLARLPVSARTRVPSDLQIQLTCTVLW